MTVKELIQELEYYNEDGEVIFEVDDEFEPDSVTEDRWGNRTVQICCKVKPWFISDSNGDCTFMLDKVVE